MLPSNRVRFWRSVYVRDGGLFARRIGDVVRVTLTWSRWRHWNDHLHLTWTRRKTCALQAIVDHASLSRGLLVRVNTSSHSLSISSDNDHSYGRLRHAEGAVRRAASRPPRSTQSWTDAECDEHVCVGLRVEFSVHVACMWPWLTHPPAALQYVI